MLTSKRLTRALYLCCVVSCFALWQRLGVVVGGQSASEPIWRTASRCDGGACMEIGTLGGAILIRNSADPDDARLTMSRGEWLEFVAGVKDGNYDGL